nr:restriction endonuclease subunit S [Mediterraneibacter glycyrrhizinilyticus]
MPYGTSKKSSSNGKIAVLRMGNLQNGEIDYSDLVYSSDEEDIKKYFLIKGDLLFNRTNSIELVGKTSIYRGDIPAIYAGYLIRIRSSLNSGYLNTVMNSSYAREYCASVRTDAVNQSNINSTKLGDFLVPVPSRLEQKRIDEKISESIKVIDIVEQEKLDLQLIVTNAKSKILDFAIRGKLVPQDSNDEPASVLLERIRAEKEKLIKQGKIKRVQKESVIFKGEDNSYYRDIPKNWELCSILNIAEVELGKTLDKGKNTGKFYPYLRSINIKWNDIDLSDLKQMRFESEEIERYSVQKNDLLICEGGDVGRCCVWKDEPILYQNALHRVRFYGSCNPYFFMYTLMLLESIGYLKSISNGVTIKHLTKSVLSTIQFPLPPLAEQKRIVEAIESAFAQLDHIINCIS